MVNPKPYLNGGNPNPKPTLSKPNLKPYRFYFHENNHPPEHRHSEDSTQDCKSVRAYFGWQSDQVIQNTYKVTSLIGGTVPQYDYLKKHFKSWNPVFDISRRNEPVATDMVCSDTPAINDGSTITQLFVGKDTLECDAYGIKSQKQFINTLYDNIKTRGAMDTLSQMVESMKFPRKLLIF